MESKINVAEILKDKPQGIRLYSPIFGECAFCFVREETDDICVKKHNGEKAFFDSKGLYNTLGECLLFPSREMRDWGRFAWKKGDVLVSNDGKVEVIFEKFRSDTYQSFVGKHHLDSIDENLHYLDEGEYSTFNFNIEKEDAAQTYINTIEERLGGKLNLETLEIEKTEFKDGDIVFVESHMLGINTSSMIAIFRKEKEIDKYKFSPALCESNEHDTYLREDSVVLSPSDIKIFRPATDSEKQQLFDAGKAWDAEKKMIVDLKPKVELKPFDKVLVRDAKKDKWSVSLFSYKDADWYFCSNDLCWKFCIPYIGNEHLVGTTKDVEG